MPPSLPLLIVFSHLRWGFVYQRPQHLMSRLAGRWRVAFVEEPVHDDGPAWLEVRDIAPDLQVLVPHTPVPAPGFHDDQLAALQTLLDARFGAGQPADVAWLYTPMALPLVRSVAPACTVFDCMDELSAFKGAPRQLRQRESALMKSAAVVFTGGPSLYEARRDQHPHVVCLPSAVDAAHYDPARRVLDSDDALTVDALQGHLPGPRLGFFGVIDERFDPSLVAAVAEAHPDWSLVMVGPVVKIDPATLPKHPNIHWLGMQSYGRLPHLLAGWDVALMPFALNESTRFISPTKTLEYMAGGKPVVSTPVRDVVSLYGEAVEIADGPAEFVRACETLLAETPAGRERRAQRACAYVERYSWDHAADTVHEQLSEALAEARRPAGTVVALAEAAPAPVAAAGGLRQ